MMSACFKRTRARGIAVRINTLVRIGTVIDEQLYHLYIALAHGEMQRAVLVVFGHIEARELLVGRELTAGILRVAHRDCADELEHFVVALPTRQLVDMVLQAGPAGETILSRDHVLGIGQLQVAGAHLIDLGITVFLMIAAKSRDRLWRTCAPRLEEFLGEELLLLEIG